MATIVLGALGTLIGGPLGGAVGALVGRQVDALIFKPSGREGPRLKDLAISTSSYGQAIPKVFGTARIAGTIIWATDLAERRTSSGGGKGKPKVTSFSYSSSFAVAVSSRPILRIGRIWADGQLLRGQAGDLKVGGEIRVHCGHPDQAVDPLLAAAADAGLCPAYRDCAYVVFEDLQLAEFGNRVPALSFEVIADEGELDLSDFTAGLPGLAGTSRPLPGLAGFELSGGYLRDTLALLDTLYPLTAEPGVEGLSLSAREVGPAPFPTLPEFVSTGADQEFGQQSGQAFRRVAGARRVPGAIRYYDQARDYQPGLQRGDGAGPLEQESIEFPGVLSAETARRLLENARLRASLQGTQMQVRNGAIDPAIAPGAVVRLPESGGIWTVESWEWRDTGIELELDRVRLRQTADCAADAGRFGRPPDLAGSASVLSAFELPLDSLSAADTPRRYLAVSAAGAGWQGAELVAGEAGGAMVSVGSSGRTRATVGTLTVPLDSSPALVLERHASVEIELVASDLALESTSERALAFGANRMLIGQEIIQFLHAQSLGAARWRLSGLVRGRGGTEHFAGMGHPAGASAVLLDETVIPVDSLSPSAMAAGTFAAISPHDSQPSVAELVGPGASLRPLHPVHPKAVRLANGSVRLAWTRRARGAWHWSDGVDVPLVEQSERYRVGAGSPGQAIREWETVTGEAVLSAVDLQGLPEGTPLWVQQIGSHALSAPLLLHILP